MFCSANFFAYLSFFKFQKKNHATGAKKKPLQWWICCYNSLVSNACGSGLTNASHPYYSKIVSYFVQWMRKEDRISLIIIDWETVAKTFINFLEKSNKMLIAELGTFWSVSQVTKNMNTNLTIALLMAEDPPSKDSFSVVTSSSFADVTICSKCNSVLSELLSPKKEQLVWFYQIINNSN